MDMFDKKNKVNPEYFDVDTKKINAGNFHIQQLCTSRQRKCIQTEISNKLESY